MKVKIECPIIGCKSTKKDIIVECDSKRYICTCSKCNTRFTIPLEIEDEK